MLDKDEYYRKYFLERLYDRKCHGCEYATRLFYWRPEEVEGCRSSHCHACGASAVEDLISRSSIGQLFDMFPDIAEDAAVAYAEDEFEDKMESTLKLAEEGGL